MGLFKFQIPADWQFDKRHASTMHVVGLDGVAWPCRIAREDSQVSLQRNRDESGHVFISYPFQEFGELVVSTGTLPESVAQGYPLTVELARGSVNRLRNQLSAWQEGGMVVPDGVDEIVRQAVVELGQSLFGSDRKRIEAAAANSLNASMRAIFQLSRAFADQVVPVRRNQVNVPKFWMGTRLHSWNENVAKIIGPIFEIIQVSNPIDINPSIQNAILGPLLDASPLGLSERLQQVDDFDARRSLLMADVRERVSHLPPSVKLIHAVSGLNGTGHRHLSYPQQLQASIDVLQTIEDAGVNIPTMVSFDCPWGERLAWSVGGVHPLQIADSLLRRGISLAMLGLDIHLDYWPAGSLPRDPLQWIDLIDLWSQLGLPLVICLRAPFGLWKSNGDSSADSQRNTPRGGLTDDNRLTLLETVIPMLLGRPAVQGIVWQQTTETDDPRYPLGGLLDEALDPKPVLQMLGRVRQKYW